MLKILLHLKPTHYYEPCKDGYNKVLKAGVIFETGFIHMKIIEAIQKEKGAIHKVSFPDFMDSALFYYRFLRNLISLFVQKQ